MNHPALTFPSRKLLLLFTLLVTAAMVWLSAWGHPSDDVTHLTPNSYRCEGCHHGFQLTSAEVREVINDGDYVPPVEGALKIKCPDCGALEASWDVAPQGLASAH